VRILYVGFAQGISGYSRYYLIPQRLINGFTRNGHNVYVFNDRDWARYSNFLRSRAWGTSKVDAKLIEICSEYKPDLIFLSNCEMVTNKALSQIKEKWPKIHISYRNVDPLNSTQNMQKIERHIGVVDSIFITTDPGYIDIKTSCTKIYFMPNPVDKSIDIFRSFEIKNHIYDIFFAGGDFRHDTDTRIDRLRAVQNVFKNLRVGFFGSAVKKPPLHGHAYLETMSNSKMGLSFDRVDSYNLYASDRMSQYLGNGLLTFVKSGKGFESLFSESDLAWFDTLDDMIQAIDRFSTDDKAWRMVAESGWRRAHNIFACEKITSWIIESCFNMDRSQDYPWAK
jgi:hypothetical protein